jgi:glycosyltransferase involved in cell wall biosynthesis
MRKSHINLTVLASYVESGGAETVLYHLLSGLDRERFQPRLVCLRNDAGFIAKELHSRGIPVVSGLSRGKFDPMVGHRLARSLRDSVDILYCLDHHNVLFWIPYLLHRVDVKSTVVVCHATRNRGGGNVFWTTDRPALSRVQRIIAVAEGQKRYLVAEEGLPPEKVEVIYNGISPEPFCDSHPRQEVRRSVREQLGLAESHRIVTIIAHLRPEKNHRRFLRIAKEVLTRLSETRFIVAGEGPERAHLEAYARSLGIGSFVHFTGVRRDIPNLLAASDVIALTSDDRVETFPMALLEAMAAGRPVIATRVGSLDEMVIDGENGHLVPVNDEALFAELLYRLLANRSKAELIGEAGRKLVRQRFTVQRMVQAHERLFETLSSGCGPKRSS